MEQTKFDITGMSCAACAARVSKAVQKVDGVKDCNVNLLTNSLTVTGEVNASVIIGAVKSAGYGATLSSNDKRIIDGKKRANAKQVKRLMIRLFTSIAILVPLMYLSMFYEMFGVPIPKFLADSRIARGIILAVLSLSVMVINYKFFVNGVMGVIRLSPNMDTLVSLGSLVSFCYSLVVLIVGEVMPLPKAMGGHLYFDSAAMILVLVTVGKTLEAYSKGKTTNAIDGLINLAPKVATVINEFGEQITVDIEKVKVGDIVIVKAGEDIPVDGVVVEGKGSVNQSSLTGESMPVLKEAQAEVYTATIVVSGVIKIRVTKVGEDTSLSKIIKMVSNASGSKAPVQKIADKVSGIFVPIVLSIALVAVVVWLIIGASVGVALSYGIAVLVVSCPCALGLATPVAIMVGSGVGAKHGILYKSATDIETLGKCKIVAFDKTGTLTLGTPRVTDVLPSYSVSEDRLLRTAFSLESNSVHPLAKAICECAKGLGYSSDDVYDYQDIIGKGVSGYFYGGNYYAGSVDFIEGKIPLNKEEKQKVQDLAQAGKTPILVCSDSEFLGIIALKDTIKEDAKEVVQKLKELKIQTVMITGDNENTAKAIAQEIGIDKVVANVLPEQKGEIIKELQKSGKVAMVGDGINDAPALTIADVGVAIGSGTDIAIDAGGVILLNSKVKDVFGAIKLSKSTIKVVYENLFWAFIYNLIGIPLAFGAFSALGFTLSPMFSAAAMSVSSIIVVCNALRINLINIYKEKKIKETVETVSIISEKTITVEGLMCKHCEQTVKTALLSVDGVIEVTADYRTGKVKTIANDEIKNNQLISLIEDKGYKVIEIK